MEKSNISLWQGEACGKGRPCHWGPAEEELMDLLKGKRNHDLKELAEKIGDDDLNKLGINGNLFIV